MNPKLKSIYLLSGDVPLLLQEGRDKIRQSASEAGFLQREIFSIEGSFNWTQLQQRLQTRSLFSDRCVIDLRINKWEETLTKLLVDYLAAPTDELVLIISGPKLTGAQQKTKWYKTIAKAGEAIAIWPIGPEALPRWIQQRLQQTNVSLDHEGIQLLAEWTEGNLLATQQAIQKLNLLFPNQRISEKQLIEALTDNARFNVFDLGNAVLLGNAERALRILNNLRQEGTEPTLILWVLAREIRQLIGLIKQYESGVPLPQILQKEWQSRKNLLSTAIKRLNYEKTLRCLQYAYRLDRMIKGADTGNYWDGFASLTVSMASAR